MFGCLPGTQRIPATRRGPTGRTTINHINGHDMARRQTLRPQIQSSAAPASIPAFFGMSLIHRIPGSVQDSPGLLKDLLFPAPLFFLFMIFPVNRKPAEEPDENGHGCEHNLRRGRRLAVEQDIERDQHEDERGKPREKYDSISLHFVITPAAISSVGRLINEGVCGPLSGRRPHGSSIPVCSLRLKSKLSLPRRRLPTSSWR